jgi:predicted ATPase
MSVALAGAHRVGKSTLAQAFAEKSGYVFLPSRAGQAHEELGLTVGLGLTAEQRMTVQERILDYHVQDIRAHVGQRWISDRSTLDFAAYTLLDAAHSAEYDHDRVAAYVDRCLKVGSSYYSTLVLIQPGITYVAEEGKPPSNVSQQEAFNFVLWGLVKDLRFDCFCGFLSRGVLDLAERVECVETLITRMMTPEIQEARQSILH